jgi:hypothetical protein
MLKNGTWKPFYLEDFMWCRGCHEVEGREMIKHEEHWECPQCGMRHNIAEPRRVIPPSIVEKLFSKEGKELTEQWYSIYAVMHPLVDCELLRRRPPTLPHIRFYNCEYPEEEEGWQDAWDVNSPIYYSNLGIFRYVPVSRFYPGFYIWRGFEPEGIIKELDCPHLQEKVSLINHPAGYPTNVKDDPLSKVTLAEAFLLHDLTLAAFKRDMEADKWLGPVMESIKHSRKRTILYIFPESVDGMRELLKEQIEDALEKDQNAKERIESIAVHLLVMPLYRAWERVLVRGDFDYHPLIPYVEGAGFASEIWWYHWVLRKRFNAWIAGWLSTLFNYMEYTKALPVLTGVCACPKKYRNIPDHVIPKPEDMPEVIDPWIRYAPYYELTGESSNVNPLHGLSETTIKTFERYWTRVAGTVYVAGGSFSGWFMIGTWAPLWIVDQYEFVKELVKQGYWEDQQGNKLPPHSVIGKPAFTIAHKKWIVSEYGRNLDIPELSTLWCAAWDQYEIMHNLWNETLVRRKVEIDDPRFWQALNLFTEFVPELIKVVKKAYVKIWELRRGGLTSLADASVTYTV